MKKMSDLTSTLDIAIQNLPRNKTRDKHHQKNRVYSRRQKQRSHSKQHSFSTKKVQEKKSSQNLIYYQRTKQYPKNQLRTLIQRRKKKYNHIGEHQLSFIMKTQESALQISNKPNTLESIIKEMKNIDVNDLNHFQQMDPIIIGQNQESFPSDLISSSQTVTIDEQDLMVQSSKQFFSCKVCLEFYKTVEIKSHFQYCIAPTMLTQYIDKWKKLTDLLQIASSIKSSPELNIISDYMNKIGKQTVSKSGKLSFMNKFGIDTSKQKQRLVESLTQKMIMIRWIGDKLKADIFDPKNLKWIIQQIFSKIIKLSQ